MDIAGQRRKTQAKTIPTKLEPVYRADSQHRESQQPCRLYVLLKMIDACRAGLYAGAAGIHKTPRYHGFSGFITSPRQGQGARLVVE